MSKISEISDIDIDKLTKLTVDYTNKGDYNIDITIPIFQRTFKKCSPCR